MKKKVDVNISKYLAIIGAAGGAAVSPRKSASSKRNGRKGGRPRKKEK